VLGLMNLVDCVNVNIITPYVEDLMSMLMHKPIGDPDLDLGISCLIGLYSICECLFSYMWGSLADRIGRKPTLLIGIAGSAVAPILMGTATTLGQAFFARALDGFFCGNVGVSKAYLGEVIEPGNEAQGFSFLALCFSCGLILGPLLGGHLSRPAESMPSIFADTIFETYPFLLPNLTYAMLAVFALVVGSVSLKETLPREKRKPICPCMRTEQRSLAIATGRPDQPLAPPLLEAESEPNSARRGGRGDDSEAATPAAPPPPQEEQPALCSLRPLRWSAVVLCCIASYFTAWTQLFAILTSADKSVMGFNLSEREIGSLNLFAAGGLLFTQLLFYPRFCKRYGYFTAFRLGVATNLLVTLPFPLYSLMADPAKFGYWRYVPLALMQAIGQAGAGFMFPTAFVWINRSAPSSVKGRANGLVNTFSALSRGSWPSLCAAVLQLLSKKQFAVPLRFLVFAQNGLLLVGAVLVTCLMPPQFSGLSPPKPTTTSSQADVAEASQGA